MMKWLRVSFRFCEKTIPFLKLVTPAIGIQQSMREEEKKAIDEEITRRMCELESTGLSRDQILLSKSQKGLPLKIDPFFQFIKSNIKAREIYLRKTDRYTADNILSIALRQDIGPDPSYARVRDGGILDTQSRAQFMHHLEDKERTAFDPKAYYSEEQHSIDKTFEQLKPKQPLRHYYKPIDRYNKQKRGYRKLKKYDIHWRNVELLRQFMTNNSAIRSRMTNMLSTEDQHAVVKAIKTARQMALLPHIGRVPQALRRNLTSLQEDVKEIGLQSIDLTSGCIVFMKPPSQDSQELIRESEGTVDNRYKKMLEDQETHKIWVAMASNQNQQTIDSESYAAYLKHKQNKAKNKIDIKEKAREMLRHVTGLSAEAERTEFLDFEDYSELELMYEKEKIEIIQDLKRNPVSVFKRILEEKTTAKER